LLQTADLFFRSYSCRDLAEVGVSIGAARNGGLSRRGKMGDNVNILKDNN
jgi:hypothetical protein